MENEELKGFLTSVRQGEIKLESEMYEPLVRWNCRECFEYSRFE